MKALLLSFLFLLVFCSTANTQWTLQHEFTGVSGIGNPSAVDENIYWGCIVYSPNNTMGYFKTTDGGNTWQDGSFNIGTVMGISCTNARSASTDYFGAYLSGGQWKIIKTTDGGTSWFTQNSAYSSISYIDLIYFFDDNNGVTLGYPVGGYLEIYTTTNGGDNWVRVPNSNIPPAYANEVGNTNAFAVIDNTIWVPIYKENQNSLRIFKSTDRGLNWTVSNDLPNPMPAGSWPYPTSIAFANQNEGILVVTNWSSPGPTSYYKLMKTTDGGSTWTEMNFPLSITPAYICHIPGASQIYVVTAPFDTVGTAYTLDGGNSWQLADNTVGLAEVQFASASTGWAINWDTYRIYEWSGPSLPVEDELEIPTEFVLEQNYPNPFNPSTTFRYSVPQTSKLIIKVYDILGNEVSLLMDEEKSVGTYELTWNAASLPSGIYFYQLKAVDPSTGSGQAFIQTRKMILLK